MKVTPNDTKAARLVLEAIERLPSSGGSTAKKIVDYIKEDNEISADLEKHINKALSQGVAFGAIRKLGNKYLLGRAVEGIRSHRRRRSKSAGGKKGKGRRRRRKH